MAYAFCIGFFVYSLICTSPHLHIISHIRISAHSHICTFAHLHIISHICTSTMDKLKNKILIVGGGSWATANVKMLTDNPVEKEIFWWMRNPKAVEHIQQFRHNPNYLSSV